MNYAIIEKKEKTILGQTNIKKLGIIYSVREDAKIRSTFHFSNEQYRIEATEDLSYPGRKSFFGVEKIAVSSDSINDPEIAYALLEANLAGTVICDLDQIISDINPTILSTPEHFIRVLSANQNKQGSSYSFYTQLKNILEPVVALCALMALSPLLLAVAAAVRLTSNGPILYSQKRVGLKNSLFNIYKFRSMKIDAEKNGAVWASADKQDSRLTPIGNFLRSSHLDELPQLWNVVCGDIGLIGPRPERPEFVARLEKEIPLFRMRTLVKPGITGLAQLCAGYANSVSDSQRKLEYDLQFILQHSFLLDIKILFGTLNMLISGGTEAKKRVHMDLQTKMMNGLQ